MQYNHVAGSQVAVRILFSLFLIVSLISPLVLTGSARSRRVARSQGTGPRAGAPEGVLPSLDEAKNRTVVKPSAPRSVSSTMRSRRSPLAPRNGRRVGDPFPEGSPLPSPSPLPSRVAKVPERENNYSNEAQAARSWSRAGSRSHHASWAARTTTVTPQGPPPLFTDDPLVAGTTIIKAQHLTELRDAVNQARSRAGLGAASWTDAQLQGVTIKAVHTVELRDRLDEARVALGMSPASYADPGLTVGFAVRAVHVQELRERVTETLTTAVGSDPYLKNFHQWAFLRQPNATESVYWNDMFRAAYQNGSVSWVLAVRELGKTIFESAEYAARNRSDHDYVYDLYKTYLMREPDQQGWDNWTAAVPLWGREHVRRGFDESTEFLNLLATITPTGTPSSGATSLATGRVDPFNQPLNGLLARDTEWSVPIVSLPGRAGLDLGLSLSYSSMVWTRSGPYLYFNEDNNSPSPGFRLGFPTIQEKSFDAQVGKNIYVLLTSGGRRVELRQVGTSNVYEAGDSSYLQLIDNGTLLVRATDGTQMSYGWFNHEFRCTEIKDRNGNYLTVNYNWLGDITTITDTLERTITFNYDPNANLISISQSWTVNGVPQTHVWASFGWGTLAMQPAFAGVSVVGASNGYTLPVVTQVGLHDGSRYNFEYTGAGQVSIIRRFTSDNVQRAYMAYDYQNTGDDCPRLSATRVWADNWTGINGVPSEVVTQYSELGDSSHQVIAPDGTIYKEFYGGTGTSPAWQKGLLLQSEVWSAGVRQKWTTLNWTQDNTAVNYQTNPRVTESNVYDAGSNRRRVTIDYGPYAQYGLPHVVKEYAADGVTELRHTFTDYNLGQQYLDRRIIGLVSAKLTSDAVWWQSKITYSYDAPSQLQTPPATTVRHDASFDTSVTARGNVTSVSRWDTTDGTTLNDPAKALTSKLGYNTNGSVLWMSDLLNHQTTLSYNDAFSDNINRNTFAYPTMVTDADNFSSSVQYNFDFGAQTRVQGPPPANQPQGLIQIFAYDSAGRLDRVATVNNGAYTRYVYGPDYVQSFATVNNVADEAYVIQVFDGVGRVRAAARNHPGSVGGYGAQHMIYDPMGLQVKQSNPTEITGSWVSAGDDAAGWLFTTQTYDWQGRPLVTTNPSITSNPNETTTKEASYSGCGCAGGEVVTHNDEVGRRQKVYSDVLGRISKTEILNWDSSVHATTANTYNARDQVTIVRQYQGTELTGIHQDVTMAYDGYGRLKSRHVPEQEANTATTYTYNSDDTVNTVTDARGGTTTFGYNGRHLVTSIAYPAAQNLPPGVAATPNVSYTYDQVGNRTAMMDGLGSTSYNYDQISRLTSETRVFSVGSYTLSYTYNLANELTSITDPFASTINYAFDTAGRVNSVTGSGYGSVSQFAYDMRYRAWGRLKSLSYSTSRGMSLGYNSRMQVSLFQVNGQNQTVGTEYQYYQDGRIRYSRDLTDGRFDRSYTYDQVARLTTNFTGAEARGVNTPDGPYKQTYGYDGWGNLNQRTGRHWSQNLEPVSFTFDAVTNRNPQWQYDAEGNVTAQDSRQYIFDAAGRQVRATDGTNYRAHEFDGDGLKATRANPGWVGYFVRSTALGGAIIAELNPQGQVWKKYIYSNGQLLAEQLETGQINWKHRNPSNTTEFVSLGTGGGRAEEYDPVGTDVGTSDPYVDPDPGGGFEDWTAGKGVPTDLTTGCSWEGMSIGCDYAFKILFMRGYTGSRRVGLKISHRSIPGVGATWLQTAHVTSRVIADDLEDSGVWSEGQILEYKNYISSPDGHESSIVRTHHPGPQNPAQPPFDPCSAIIAQFPASGQGYYTYDSANERYGQGEVVSSLVNFASNWNQNHPNNPIGVGDISLRGGGNIAGHFEHERGLQVDIRPMRNDNVNGPTNFNAANYSFDLTNSLVQGLLGLNNVVSVRFNDPNIQGTVRDRNRYDRRGRRLPGVHDNHLHVTFQSSAPCP